MVIPDPDNKISNQIVVNGKRFKVDGTVDLKFTPMEDTQPIPDPDPSPDVPKPEEGTIKEGGWGGNTDPKTWHVTEMRNPSTQFKVVDDKGVNIATNFTTMQQAQNFINYFLVNPFPPEEEEEEQKPEEGTEGSEGNNPGGGSADGGDVVVGKGQDKHGSQLLVSDGKEVEYVIKDNLRDDGQRFDGNVGDWPSSEATGYFMFTKDPVDDEVSIKWSEINHSGKNQVQCYDTGVSIKDGKARMRFENPHPEYSGNLGSGQGEPMKAGKYYGYKGAKIVNKDGTVTVKLWQSTGDNEEKPSNDWKEIYNYTDKKYKRTGAHPFVTFRVDDPAKKGQPNLRKKWLSVAKI